MTLVADRPTKLAKVMPGGMSFYVIVNGGPGHVRVGTDPFHLATEGIDLASGTASPQLTITDELWVQALAVSSSIQIQVQELKQ